MLVQISEGDKADVDKAVKAARAAFAIGSEWRTMDASERGRLMVRNSNVFMKPYVREMNVFFRLAQVRRPPPARQGPHRLPGDRRQREALLRLGGGRGVLRPGHAVLRGVGGQGQISTKVELTVVVVVVVAAAAAVTAALAAAAFNYPFPPLSQIHGETIPVDGSFFTFTRREPVGVVGQIIPWNYPLAMLAWKWGPALAAGCTIVLKPAEQTPLSALYAANLAKEAGWVKI